MLQLDQLRAQQHLRASHWRQGRTGHARLHEPLRRSRVLSPPRQQILEEGESSFRGREDLHIAGADLRVRVDKKVPLLFHGLNRCGSRLPQHLSPRAVHHLQEEYAAHRHQSAQEHVPGEQ